MSQDSDRAGSVFALLGMLSMASIIRDNRL